MDLRPNSEHSRAGRHVAGAACFVERRARRRSCRPGSSPNRTFLISSAVGFIVGLAMFGAVTCMPVYLQVVQGISRSRAGPALLSLIGRLFLTSIISGRIISEIGRYRMFPIAGTALMAIGLWLMSFLGIGLAIAAPVVMIRILCATADSGRSTSATARTLYPSGQKDQFAPRSQQQAVSATQC